MNQMNQISKSKNICPKLLSQTIKNKSISNPNEMTTDEKVFLSSKSSHEISVHVHKIQDSIMDEI